MHSGRPSPVRPPAPGRSPEPAYLETRTNPPPDNVDSANAGQAPSTRATHGRSNHFPRRKKTAGVRIDHRQPRWPKCLSQIAHVGHARIPESHASGRGSHCIPGSLSYQRDHGAAHHQRQQRHFFKQQEGKRSRNVCFSEIAGGMSRQTFAAVASNPTATARMAA